MKKSDLVKTEIINKDYDHVRCNKCGHRFYFSEKDFNYLDKEYLEKHFQHKGYVYVLGNDEYVFCEKCYPDLDDNMMKILFGYIDGYLASQVFSGYKEFTQVIGKRKCKSCDKIIPKDSWVLKDDYKGGKSLCLTCVISGINQQKEKIAKNKDDLRRLVKLFESSEDVKVAVVTEGI